MSFGRTVSGFAALAAATFAAQVSGFLVLAVLARRLGPDGLGAYALATAIVPYFAIPANFGVAAYAVRELAQDPDSVRPITGQVLVLQAVLGVVPYLALLVLAPLLAPDPEVRRLLPVIGLGLLLEIAALQWVLYAQGTFVFAAVARLIGALIYALLCVTLVHGGSQGLTRLGWIHVAAIAATAALTAAAVFRRIGRPPLRWRAAELRRRFRASVPLGVAGVMILVYYSVDSVMLGWLKDTRTVGQYAVAYRVPLAVLSFAALWGQVLYPHAAVLAVDRRDELREQLGWFASLSLVASLPVLTGALLVGPDLMPQLFGPRFAASGTPFVILMGAAALVFFSVNYGTVLQAMGEERRFATAVTFGALANVLANLVVIPLFGMVGAASATVGAELVVFAFLWVRVHRSIGSVPHELGRIGRAALATAVMTAVLLALDDAVGGLGRSVIGAAVFVICALAVGAVRPGELRRLIRRGEPALPAPG